MSNTCQASWRSYKGMHHTRACTRIAEVGQIQLFTHSASTEVGWATLFFAA